ncbi:hypothetical protein GVAV_000112 [Gurleya vavrai]
MTKYFFTFQLLIELFFAASNEASVSQNKNLANSNERKKGEDRIRTFINEFYQEIEKINRLNMIIDSKIIEILRLINKDKQNQRLMDIFYELEKICLDLIDYFSMKDNETDQIKCNYLNIMKNNICIGYYKIVEALLRYAKKQEIFAKAKKIVDDFSTTSFENLDEIVFNFKKFFSDIDYLFNLGSNKENKV